MKRTAAIYVRVSSDRQKEEGTIASQREALLAYAQAQELTVPAEWIFQDEGYSGAVLTRPGLEHLRDLVAEGQVEVVLVYAPDRLSRKYAYQVLLMEEFARLGVETRFVKAPSAQTPEERLLLQFQGMIAEYERALIAERTRRGKRYRARAGAVSALSVAPYGYRYIKKTEHSVGYFVVQESEAGWVRRIFELYTQERWSIGAIARQLNQERIATRFGKGPWHDTTVLGMLRNPAYQGEAAYGKTQNCPSQKRTRPARQRGGFGRRASRKPVDKAEWIPVAVPALVSRETFALAQERLAENRRLSLRNTKIPSLLQGLLVCEQCGYGLYRSSSGSLAGARGRVQYYRCTGADRYRHLAGPVCSCRMIRVDYLDQLVWQQLLELLRRPELVRAELERRREQNLHSSPVQQRKEQLERELSRSKQQLDKLLDAYQEDLLTLADLRERAPELRRKIGTLEKERQSQALRALEEQRWSELNQSLEAFLTKLNQTVEHLSTEEQQRIVRLLVKQVDVGKETITIHHSIPVIDANAAPAAKSPLYTAHPGADRCRLSVEHAVLPLRVLGSIGICIYGPPFYP
jgi:site-specific DNA recombinase